MNGDAFEHDRRINPGQTDHLTRLGQVEYGLGIGWRHKAC